MTGSDIRGLLAQSPLFEGLPQPLLDDVLQAVSLRMMSAKASLFHQGDLPKEFILLGKGVVKVWQIRSGGEPTTIRVMTPGDIIGGVAVFRQIPFPATATAVTDCILLVWSATRINDLMERYPVIRTNALNFVGQRTEELVHRLGEMATERVEQRVARTLLRLGDRTGRTVPEGTEIGYPLSRQDIAEIAGTDLYSVSRVLRDWTRRGVVASGRLRVVLRDRHGLERIAEGR